jgi:hypothetical protein
MREWHDIHSQLAGALGARQSARARAELASEADEDDDVLTVGSAAPDMDDAAASAAQAREADWMFGGERYRAVHRPNNSAQAQQKAILVIDVSHLAMGNQG